jgi:hypothetical protein
MTQARETRITPEAYGTLQDAYELLNARLWDGRLPDLLITLQRRRGYGGYFGAQRFRERGSDPAGSGPPAGEAHEIALNPDGFVGQTDRWVASVLAHEMAHVWQQEFGAPSRRGYHNRQWGAEMKRIGLHPSSTGAAGGKETGQRMSHYVVEAGLFAAAWDDLGWSGFALRWESANASAPDQRGRDAKLASKTRYTCPACGTNAWAKRGVALLCGECVEHSGPTRLVAENETAGTAHRSAGEQPDTPPRAPLARRLWRSRVARSAHR